MLIQLGNMKRLPEFGVALLEEGVQIFAYGALEDKGSLGDDGDAPAQSAQSHLQRVIASQIVLGTDHRFCHPEEHLDDGGLA